MRLIDDADAGAREASQAVEGPGEQDRCKAQQIARHADAKDLTAAIGKRARATYPAAAQPINQLLLFPGTENGCTPRVEADASHRLVQSDLAATQRPVQFGAMQRIGRWRHHTL